MKGFDIELSVLLSETDMKTISKAFNNVYEQGYQQGATYMEKAKQIIIDGLLKQLDKIRELMPTCDRYKDYGCTNSADDCYECMMESLDRIAEQLKDGAE